jgi:acetylornithine deacetylase/succinyl-diaminopimelate desuccinylase-like protein
LLGGVSGSRFSAPIRPGRPSPDFGLFGLLAGVLGELAPDGMAIPYLLPGVTDGRFFARLGIQTYGFTPLQLPPGFNFTAAIHAADERVPVSALPFGTQAIGRVLERYQG